MQTAARMSAHRCHSASLWHAQEARPEIEKRPGISYHEIFQEMSRRWKELSEAERKAFDDMELADKKRYEEELAKWRTPRAIAKK